jgi:hypothetical protein
MSKGRIWPIIAIAIGLVLVFLVCRASPLLKQGEQETALPVNLQNVIPSSWTPLPNQPVICDYDRDGEDEWLILFRYDTTQVQVPYKPPDTTEQRGPIGGVIYDAQVNYVPQEPGNRSPYRPALLIPYMLLPDFYPGKGQGYLGESDATLTQYSPSSQQEGKCIVDEIYVFGYTDSPFPTRLSTFRWHGKATGYAVTHFAGNARIAADLPTDNSKPLGQVTTYDRLGNHRSLLCEVKQFVRQGEPAELNFPEDPSAYTIDFCFDAPNDPYYPEGVVVALLRGNVPQNTQNMPASIGESYLMADVTLPPELGDPSQSPVRILSVVNQGAVETQPEQSGPCPQQSVATLAPAAEDSTSSGTWWCGNEQSEVVTEVVLSGQTQRVLWRLISVANDQVNADTHWRVSDVGLY